MSSGVQSRRPWGLLLAVGAAAMASTMGCSAVFSLAPDMMRDFGIKEAHMAAKGGILIGAYFAGLISSFGWGIMTDRIGRRPVLLISLFGITISLVIIGAATTLRIAVFGRFLEGLLESFRVVCPSIIADISTDADETFNMGVLSVGKQMGFLVGPWVAGIFGEIDVDSWIFRYPNHLTSFLPITIGCLLSFCHSALALADLPATKEKCNERDFETAHRERAKTEPESQKEKSPLLKRDERDESIELNDKNKTGGLKSSDVEAGKEENTPVNCYLYLVLGVFALSMLGSKGFAEAKSLWSGLEESHGGLGLSASEIGYVITISNLPVIPACLWLAPIQVSYFGRNGASKLNAVFSAITTMFIPCVKLFVLPLPWRIALLTVVSALQRCSHVVLLQTTSSLINEWSSVHQRGTCQGLGMSAYSLISGFGSVFVGFTVSANDAEFVEGGEAGFFNYGFIFIVCSSVYFVVFIVLFVIPKEAPVREVLDEDR